MAYILRLHISDSLDSFEIMEQMLLCHHGEADFELWVSAIVLNWEDNTIFFSFVKTGIVSVTKCFEIWTAVTSRYVSADGENKFSIQEVKILSIAFIWLLEVSAGDEDIIAQLYTGQWSCCQNIEICCWCLTKMMLVFNGICLGLSFLSSSLKELSSLIG